MFNGLIRQFLFKGQPLENGVAMETELKTNHSGILGPNLITSRVVLWESLSPYGHLVLTLPKENKGTMSYQDRSR